MKAFKWLQNVEEKDLLAFDTEGRELDPDMIQRIDALADQLLDEGHGILEVASAMTNRAVALLSNVEIIIDDEIH